MYLIIFYIILALTGASWTAFALATLGWVTANLVVHHWPIKASYAPENKSLAAHWYRRRVEHQATIRSLRDYWNIRRGKHAVVTLSPDPTESDLEPGVRTAVTASMYFAIREGMSVADAADKAAAQYGQTAGRCLAIYADAQYTYE